MTSYVEWDRAMNAWRDLWLRAALVLSALTPLCFLAAAFGVKYQILSWDFGVGVLTLKVLPVLASLGLAAAVIALVLSWTARPLRRRRLALISTMAPAVALAVYFVVTSSTAKLPPIHDI
jgi:hypothetical protein